MANIRVKRPTDDDMDRVRNALDSVKVLWKKWDISPMGEYHYIYSRSNMTDDLHITVTSDGYGTHTVRKFTGPLIDTEGSGNQDEVDCKDNLSREEAMKIAEEWKNELEEE